MPSESRVSDTHHEYNASLDIPQAPMLIEHLVNGDVVPQRPQDGYINATRLCKQAGKQFGHYNANAQTQEFLMELSAVIGIPITGLVQIIQGGNNQIKQGTWVHPRVAVHLGQWLSPQFAVQVSEWVHDWMSGTVHPFMPEYVQRFMKNKSKIPHTHFSMLNEIYLDLYAVLEENGIILPDSMMPDISTGRMFSGFLRQNGIDPDKFPYYSHEFAKDSRVVRARLYPIELLPAFRKYFNETWLPERSPNYFAEREPKVLPYLSKFKALPSPETN